MKQFVLCVFLSMAGVAAAGEIALTFDDAPMPGMTYMSGTEKTDRIIKGLKSQGVNDALFFVTTKYLSKKNARTRLEKYASEGFHLANHSHMHLSANKLSTEDYLDDMYKSHKLMKGMPNYVKLHRFPFLHYGKDEASRQKLYTGLKKIGYKVGYVTVDNYEWYLNKRFRDAKKYGFRIDYDALGKLYVDSIWQAIEHYDDLAKKTLGRSPAHVLLLHENELAAMYIGDLVAHIKSKGWKIISPQRAYEDSIAKISGVNLEYNNQGRVAAIAYDKGVKKSAIRHPMENEKSIDKLIRQYKVIQ